MEEKEIHIELVKRFGELHCKTTKELRKKWPLYIRKFRNHEHLILADGKGNNYLDGILRLKKHAQNLHDVKLLRELVALEEDVKNSSLKELSYGWYRKTKYEKELERIRHIASLDV